MKDGGMRRPVGATLTLCELGAVSGDLWRSVLGLWPNALLYRRCALGLLDNVYNFSPAGSSSNPAVARLPSRVKAELLTLVALSSLF